MASGISKKKHQKSPARFASPRSIHSGASFKLYQRKEFARDLEVPGMMHHILYSFKLIFKNWKIFLPFLLIMVLVAILFAGLMSENTYQELQTTLDKAAAENDVNINTFAKSGLLLISTIFTGGLMRESAEVTGIFTVLIFLIIWLTTIFILRHKMAGHEVKLRDGLYNAMAPLISTFVVLVVAAIQAIPIILLIVAYSAAIETHFLDTPFYALLFLGFAGLMILLSSYLLSGTIMALTAVSAPGLYPMVALKNASELMRGRRIKFVLRIIALLVILVVMWAIVMMPLIMFDLFMKQFEWTYQIPFIPVCLVVMTCFTMMYATTYFYTYYRWLLDFSFEEEKFSKRKPKKGKQ